MTSARRYLALAPAVLLLLTASLLNGQTTEETLQPLLAPVIESPAASALQMQQFLTHRIPALPTPGTPGAWTEQQQRLRRHILDDVAYHGWPAAWVNSAPSFQEVGAVISGDGYRLHKLRYEIVPGFAATALLYEPQTVTGKVPAILNVIGHEPMGNAAEYEQKRCINFARRGMYALSLGWIGFGEMAIKGDAHDDAASLDLVGSNALGFFYLGMRRGLDYLATLPQVDTTRLGVTGLSGGGWQTIVLSSTDPRVAVAVEVAGFGGLPHNIAHPDDTSEIEEEATDFAQGQDYPFLVAMRAPRPTLLIHNAEDDCCFRAALVKPDIYDQVRPFFQLFDKPDNLRWYESDNPGTHNYQLFNRLQSYRFFDEHFHLKATPDEIASSSEVRTPQELAIGVPADNLTLIGLARKLAADNERPAGQTVAAQQEKLKQVIRYAPVTVEQARRAAATKHMTIRTLSYRFDLSNGLSASGVWLQAQGAQDNAPMTIVLNDKGYAASSAVVAEHVNRGEQVLALDLIFNGSMRPEAAVAANWELLVATTGDRPLGLEAAQLVGIANWLRAANDGRSVHVETDGMRSGVIADVAAAMQPTAFSSITSHHAIASLAYLLDTPVPYRSAPDLFCLDLYKYFDVDSIKAIAAPTTIKNVD